MPSWTAEDYKSHNIKIDFGSRDDFLTGIKKASSSIDFNDTSSFSAKAPSASSSSSLVTIHKRNSSPNGLEMKASKKYKLVSNPVATVNLCNSSPEVEIESLTEQVKRLPADRMEYLKVIKRSLPIDRYRIFLLALQKYRGDEDFEDLWRDLVRAFNEPRVYYILMGLRRFIRDPHVASFDARLDKIVNPK